jgi:hypothetical protein
MLAKGSDALGAGVLDREQTAAVGMTRNARYFDGLAAKCVRHINVVSADKGDAIAEMTDVIDRETLNHGARR